MHCINSIALARNTLHIFLNNSHSLSASDVQAELEREMAADEGMPTVKHYREREYAGMFEYRKEDEPLLIRNLIIGKQEPDSVSRAMLKLVFSSRSVPAQPSLLFLMTTTLKM